MSEAPTHRQFFGDQERAFRLDPGMIQELERVTGTGIGGLCKRLFAGDFHYAEIAETIRLAMIGGGTPPEEAAALIAAYVAARPLDASYALAVAILETLWFGAAQTGEEEQADG